MHGKHSNTFKVAGLLDRSMPPPPHPQETMDGYGMRRVVGLSRLRPKRPLGVLRRVEFGYTPLIAGELISRQTQAQDRGEQPFYHPIF